ncbi:MAG: N-acetyltransferase [Deltaproteobacteria bacterium]|nr:MAG: N-acetyltransferase [Deltaproteobacteria bacterium]
MQEGLFEAGEDCRIQTGCIVGLKYRDDCRPAVLGKGARIRAGTIIYADVVIGDDFQTGHHVMIREKTAIGHHVVVGTNTVIDGQVSIGDFVKIESNCYIPTNVTVGSRIFLGPNVTLTNDRYPLKMRDQYRPEGPVLEDGVTLGAGVIVCPGVRIGEGSFVAAGAVVTKDVPPRTMVKGVPGRFSPLPEKLRELNIALSWMKYLKA